MPSPSRRRFLAHVGATATLPVVSTAGPSRTSSATPGVAWQHTYGGHEYQCDALVDGDGAVLLVGRTGSSRGETPWLAAVGPDGDQAWSTTVDAPGFARAVDAVPAESGYTVLLQTDERQPIHLVSLAADGSVRWRTHLETEGHVGAHVLRRTADGYLVGGFRGNRHRTVADLQAWLRATDESGATRWEHSYDASIITDVVPAGDGHRLAGVADDDAWLQAVGTDGSPRWRHTYGGVRSEYAFAAVPTGSGVLYGGRTESAPDGHERAMLVQTTADGQFVWRRNHAPQSIVDLHPYGDTFALTGEPPSLDTTGRNPEKPVAVVDRWGRVVEEVTVTVDSGEPVGLATFDGVLAVGGRHFDEGIWLAKVRLGG